MKAQSKVGFLGKTGDDIEYLYYYDVLDYCLNKIKEEGKTDDFNNSGLSPFDYVVGSMRYVFVNPLFNNDKYLVCRSGLYYSVSKQKVMDTCDMNPDDSLYQNIMTTFYDDLDANIFMLQNSKDAIHEVDFLEESMDCFILENGKIIKKEDYYRHSALANTICNNELIKSKDFCQAYIEEMTPSTHYSELFLVDKCNFVEIDYESDSCVILYNNEKINSVQKEVIKNVIGEDVTVLSTENQGSVSSLITSSNQKAGEGNLKR